MTRFEPGLQTHFPNAPVAGAILDTIRPRVYWHRMDVQHADEWISRGIYMDITSRARMPLVTVWSSREVWFHGAHYEFQNERSIKLGSVPKLHGAAYRWQFDLDFYPAVKAMGGVPYYGAAANFEDRDLDWYRDGRVSTLPADVRFTIHDYWTGTLDQLQYRLNLWRDIIGHERLYLISEAGLKSAPEPQHAAWTRERFAFWSRQPNCLGMVFYQIKDSPTDDHDYGLYDEHGRLKSAVFAAFPFVQESEMAVSSTLLFTFNHAAVIHNPDGTKAVRWNLAEQRADANSNRVFSLQPNGTIEDRPLDVPDTPGGPVGIGAWEKGTIEHNRRALVFRVGQARAVFAWQD